MTKEFLYKTIEDAQATIRAIDVKLGFLFVVVFLPVAALGSVIEGARDVYAGPSCYFFAMAAVFLSWFLSLVLLLKSVSTISNPGKHVSLGLGEGVYYGAGLYRFKFIDGFFNFPNASKYSLDEYLVKIPRQEAELLRELTYEKMKLGYIRDVKIYRYSWCVFFVRIWLLLGSALWVVKVLKVGL